jgi:hypothetical protein
VLSRAAAQIDCVNVKRLDARLLLLNLPPHVLKPDHFRVGRTNKCHVAVIGNGDVVEELIAHAVRSLVYDPQERIRVTALVADAAGTARRFHVRFPALTQDPNNFGHRAYGGQLPLADITFAETVDAPIQANALLQAHAAQPIDAIYVAGHNDTETSVLAAEAVKVAEAMSADRPHVVACLDDPAAMVSIDEVLNDSKATARPRVRLHVFRLHTWQKPAANSQGPDDFADDLARPVWCAYKQMDPMDPQAIADWKAQPVEEKWWNRCAGDHAAIKLALLGNVTSDQELANRLDPAAFHWLASLEHRRYVCERLTDGWLWREGDKLVALHLNPTLGAYAPLLRDEQEKDERIVLLLRQLRMANAAIQFWHAAVQPAQVA